MPTGKVRFFDEEKGYGFIESDEGQQVFLHATNLPDGVTTIRKGSRVEFSIVDGRKGPQVLTMRLLEPKPSLAKAHRKPADDLAIIVEDTIAVLDKINGGLKHGRHPEGAAGKKIAALLRKLADELEA
ncbi:MAG: cold-shock protein [Micrococcales bacterium]